jgi:hypothetical protein
MYRGTALYCSMYCSMYCSYDLMRELQLGITFSIAQAALVSAVQVAGCGAAGYPARAAVSATDPP